MYYASLFSPFLEAGSPEGCIPHWQAEWRMCLHNRRFFTFPLRESGESREVQPHWQAPGGVPRRIIAALPPSLRAVAKQSGAAGGTLGWRGQGHSPQPDGHPTLDCHVASSSQ